MLNHVKSCSNHAKSYYAGLVMAKHIKKNRKCIWVFFDVCFGANSNLYLFYVDRNSMIRSDARRTWRYDVIGTLVRLTLVTHTSIANIYTVYINYVKTI